MNKAQINDLIDRIIKLFNLNISPVIVTSSLLKFYDKGLEQSEIQLNLNFTRDEERFSTLNDYVLGNIKGANEEIREKLRKEITQGVVNLESVPQVRERIMSVMDVSKARAQMIARTELNRAEGVGHMDGARQSGLKLKKYVSAKLDSRTSPICQGLDKKYGTKEQAIPLDAKFKFNGEEWDINPFHVNCRSTVLYTQVD